MSVERSQIKPDALTTWQAREVCDWKARELADRWIRAANFQTKVKSIEIVRALERWDIIANGRTKPRRVVRGVGPIRISYHRARLIEPTHRSESKAEARVVHQVRQHAVSLLTEASRESNALLAIEAICTRMSSVADIYRPGDFHVIPDAAAITIGAAAVPVLRMYNTYLPLLEAFEAGCLMFWEMPDRILYVERPYVFKKDSQDRLHCEDGPALVWGEGISYHYWKGTFVPAVAISTPIDRITPTWIDDEWNAEVRRCLLDRMGEENYIIKSGMHPVVSDRFGTIYVRYFVSGRPIARLRVVNSSPEPDGTYKVYWLAINPDLYDGRAGIVPQAAAASTWRTTPGGKELFFKDYHEYDPRIET